ncbi:MAG: hypothetical protein ACTSPB_17975 [Candidatus Thorarchaeota archaeon]
MSKTFDEKILEDIIERAIQEGKLFELLFTNNGRRLWSSWPEERMRKKVKAALGRRKRCNK